MSASGAETRDPRAEFGPLLESLRQAAADKLEPVQFHHVKALAERVQAQQGSVRGVLHRKLEQAAADLRLRLEQARVQAQRASAECAQRHPDAAAELQRLLADGDVPRLRRAIAALQQGRQSQSLADLSRDLTGGRQEQARSPGQREARPELKSVHYFRETWGRISADKRVTQALGQAPKNAGPINSHAVALRSLALMRELSPDYLNRFISYVDTLLCLEQCERENQLPAKVADGGKGASARRVRSR